MSYEVLRLWRSVLGDALEFSTNYKDLYWVVSARHWSDSALNIAHCLSGQLVCLM